MSTENELKELMGLAGALAQDSVLYSRGVVQINKVETSAKVLEDRLLCLLTELEAAREDAQKNKVDADCFRWWVHEAAVNPGLVAKAIAHCISEDDYRKVICGAMEAKNAAIDAARKGEA